MERADRQRRICYVGTSFPVASDFRFAHKQCPGLVKRGYSVCYFAQADEDMDCEGVKIYGFSRQRSMLKQALLPWRLLGRLLRQPCDAYHLSTAEMLPLALVLKVLTRRRVVFDFREDYIEFVRLKPYLRGPLKWLGVATVRVLIRLVCRMMDGVIFGDEGVQESYPRVPAKRQMFIHHFPLLSLFSPSPIPFAERKYDVVYLGSMTETGGIFVMLEALSILKRRHRDLKFLLIGAPAVYIEERFDEFVKDKDLDGSIEITGRVPYPQVPGLLDQAKVGLIGLRDLPKFHKQSASKLFEYMAKGIPCVSVDLPPERRFMTPGQDGYFVPPEDPEAMADAVERILSDPALGQEMADRGRRNLMEKGYYAEKELDELAVFYDYILSNARRSVLSSSKD